jgi:hypothetical protein
MAAASLARRCLGLGWLSAANVYFATPALRDASPFLRFRRDAAHAAPHTVGHGKDRRLLVQAGQGEFIGIAIPLVGGIGLTKTCGLVLSITLRTSGGSSSISWAATSASGGVR